ncbi:MAG: 4Fe-4S dicluster domain-containing protein [Chloroflexi bacterium]|nr:4Fe-4S dicluster domain-containing protein [Chloroflexota bacterium]
MKKILVVEADNCNGCRICEMYCSITHTGACNPETSRIRIIKRDESAVFLPTVCHQCERPLCAEACPTNAITKSDESRLVSINNDECIGCEACIIACPLGGLSLDPQTNKPLMCDLCNGDPMCVKTCPTGALLFMDATQLALQKRRQAMARAGCLPTRSPDGPAKVSSQVLDNTYVL